MNTKCDLLLVGTVVQVVRKPIKNLHLSVLPPAGRVRVTVPEHMKDDTIRTLIALRLPWIKKQQEKFSKQARQTMREYVSGESHYYFGKRYRLELVQANCVQSIVLKGKTKIVLQARPSSSVAGRHRMMNAWYRAQMHPMAEKLMAKWQKKLGVEAAHWGIMQMKTRWGTCNHKRGRILLNLELAKKPVVCLEYVVVHELLHLLVKKHDECFTDLMTRHLPKWRSIKDELNAFILSHEEWNNH